MNAFQKSVLPALFFFAASCWSGHASAIAMSAAMVPRAIFAAVASGTISGNVTEATTGYPLVGALIHVFDTSGIEVATTVTAGNSQFLTPSLPGSGDYYVLVEAPQHDVILYPDIPCVGGCNPLAGTPVAVGAGESAIGTIITPRIAFPLDEPQILYVNRCSAGCAVHPGTDNVFANSSTVPNQESTLSAFAFSDETFDRTFSCMRRVFAPYSVIVTIEDPGALPHRELMLAGTPQQIHLPNGVGGVGPWFYGLPAYDAIAFAFANSIGDDVEQLCHVATHESGHLFGLDHELYAPDTMSYLPVTGIQYFTDYTAACGEDTSRACDCNGVGGGCGTQNTHSKLQLELGDNRIFIDSFDPDDFAQPIDSNVGRDLTDSGLRCATHSNPARMVPAALWPH